MSPQWSRWACVTTTASSESSGRSSGALKYGVRSEPGSIPQSMRTFEFWVVSRWALRPTSR